MTDATPADTQCRFAPDRPRADLQRGGPDWTAATQTAWAENNSDEVSAKTKAGEPWGWEREVCTGCSASLTLADIKARGCVSCCPDRHMVTVRDLVDAYETALRARSSAPEALQAEPAAYIVWNEARTEGVIFTDLERAPDEPSAYDDAVEASTGKHDVIGSVLGREFYQAFEDDDERPIRPVSLALLKAADAR